MKFSLVWKTINLNIFQNGIKRNSFTTFFFPPCFFNSLTETKGRVFSDLEGGLQYFSHTRLENKDLLLYHLLLKQGGVFSDLEGGVHFARSLGK